VNIQPELPEQRAPKRQRGKLQNASAKQNASEMTRRSKTRRSISQKTNLILKGASLRSLNKFEKPHRIFGKAF
jgi:hypothetical protein